MDIKEKRKLDLFHFVVDFSFGSLWHIKESFWARTIPGFRPKRKWHPGLSIYNGSAITMPIIFSVLACFLALSASSFLFCTFLSYRVITFSDDCSFFTSFCDMGISPSFSHTQHYNLSFSEKVVFSRNFHKIISDNHE